MAEDLRSRAELEAEIASARARLAENLEALVGEAHPKSIAQRRVEDVKEFASSEFTNAKEKAQEQIQDRYGNLRLDRVAMLGGAVVGVVTLAIVASVRTRKRKQRER